MNMLKITVEDVAFNMWNGKVDELDSFIAEFFENYGAFDEFWEPEELKTALLERL